MTHRLTASLLSLILLSTNGASAAPAVDAGTINRIADEEFNHGQVIHLVAHLTDRIGSRMTNSPAMRQAEQWSQDMFRSWGLKDVHAEPFAFGRGWWIESAHTRMTVPRVLQLRTIPTAWTVATKGPLTASVVVAPIRHQRDLAEWKGKLKDKIVMISFPAPPSDAVAPAFKRLDEGELGKLNSVHQPTYDPDDRERLKRNLLAQQIDRFVAAEGGVAIVTMSRDDDGLVHGEGRFYKSDNTLTLPAVEMAAEDYRRLARLAKVGEVKIEIDNQVHFDDRDPNAYNIIADIAGKDPKAGYVMAGAHLDSWVAGDGAADNAAGSAIVMEAARILSKLGVKPKRTIRFALWSGEEQGLLGSAAYVERHLAKRAPPSDPVLAALPSATWNTYPVSTLPGFNEMVAYFNLDNGSGKIRGIYAEGNFAAIPMLRNWLAPFDSMGANKVVAQRTGSTDHVLMARLGLPAFQFIQDPLDYFTKVHHTNLDTYDHLRTEDLRQAAVILATTLLNAADSDTPLPRNVLPSQPEATDPFRYKDPAKN